MKAGKQAAGDDKGNKWRNMATAIHLCGMFSLPLLKSI